MACKAAYETPIRQASHDFETDSLLGSSRGYFESIVVEQQQICSRNYFNKMMKFKDNPNGLNRGKLLCKDAVLFRKEWLQKMEKVLTSGSMLNLYDYRVGAIPFIIDSLEKNYKVPRNLPFAPHTDYDPFSMMKYKDR